MRNEAKKDSLIFTSKLCQMFKRFGGRNGSEKSNHRTHRLHSDQSSNKTNQEAITIRTLCYSQLRKLEARSITVGIDACFSGSSDDGMLLKNIRCVFLEVK